jgi:hypothetical protein
METAVFAKDDPAHASNHLMHTASQPHVVGWGTGISSKCVYPFTSHAALLQTTRERRVALSPAIVPGHVAVTRGGRRGRRGADSGLPPCESNVAGGVGRHTERLATMRPSHRATEARREECVCARNGGKCTREVRPSTRVAWLFRRRRQWEGAHQSAIEFTRRLTGTTHYAGGIGNLERRPTELTAWGGARGGD